MDRSNRLASHSFPSPFASGTLDYMSPEVLQFPDKTKPNENKHLEGYGPGCDVWAAGVLAYELLVSQPAVGRGGDCAESARNR